MGHAVEEPAQGGTFQRPGHRDPLPLELDRKYERDEKQRRPAEPRQNSIAVRMSRGKPFQHYNHAAEQRERKRRGQQAHQAIGPRGVHHPVNEREMQRHRQCGHGPRHRRIAALRPADEWERHEHRREGQIP